MLRRLSREGSDVERDNVGGDLVAKRYDLAIIGTGTAAIVSLVDGINFQGVTGAPLRADAIPQRHPW